MELSPPEAGGLPDSWLLASEGPDTFSPRDVIGHLIHGEETDWVPRLRLILRHGESDLRRQRRGIWRGRRGE